MLQKKAEKKHNLNIIIVGIGKVGGTLVEQLSKEGNDITIIDKNPSAVQAMSGLYDVMGVGGKMFTVAGPVLVFGISASIIVGILYLIFNTQAITLV